MKWTLCLLSAVAANAISIRRDGAEAGSSLEKRAFSLGIPSDCLQPNGIAFGFLPASGDNGVTYTMAEINSKLGLSPACTYGWYSQIGSLPYNDDQLTEIMSDLKSSGAVFQPAVMPTLSSGFSSITSTVANEIAAAMKTFTDEGIEVWLRFGHEANYYASVGTYKGTASQFVTAWKNVWTAVQGNDLVKMFWSPNIDSVANITPWFPGASYVDIVGVDCYPSGTITSSSFDNCYLDFYNAFSKAYDKPFAIGETGAGDGEKEAWLTALVTQPTADWPNYVSASWFEYDKEADFRIVETDATTLAETKKTLSEPGTGTAPGSGSGTTTTTASGSSATCDWGCYGWDCSSSVPCATPWQCVSGYCKDCNWGCEGWDCSASVPCQSPYTCQSGYCH